MAIADAQVAPLGFSMRAQALSNAVIAVGRHRVLTIRPAPRSHHSVTHWRRVV
jgi:hypothetical protein